MKYTFISDPGHGWLQVARTELRRLGIEHQISGYSYQHAERAYLEEDKDMGVFLAAKEKAGEIVEITDRVCNTESPVRSYAPYQPRKEQYANENTQ